MIGPDFRPPCQMSTAKGKPCRNPAQFLVSTPYLKAFVCGQHRHGRWWSGGAAYGSYGGQSLIEMMTAMMNFYPPLAEP